LSSPQVELAREVVDAYITRRQILPTPVNIPPEMQARAGVFVSIHKGEDLRGCIGTIEASRNNIAEEIIANAIAASTRDPRFEPITPEELPDLDINVDVLTEPEPVADISQLDPKKYGLIVECGYRRGLLLPDLPQVERVEDQIDICCDKGGIGRGERLKLYRFEVKRYR
jgi:AmmeMemoRadiSam system protein A